MSHSVERLNVHATNSFSHPRVTQEIMHRAGHDKVPFQMAGQLSMPSRETSIPPNGRLWQGDSVPLEASMQK